MAVNTNKTKVTYTAIENGEPITKTVEVDGTLNGGRALAAAKRATGNKQILLVSVEHITQKWHFSENGFAQAVESGFVILD